VLPGLGVHEDDREDRLPLTHQPPPPVPPGRRDAISAGRARPTRRSDVFDTATALLYLDCGPQLERFLTLAQLAGTAAHRHDADKLPLAT
jgi:hypothetical protein